MSNKKDFDWASLVGGILGVAAIGGATYLAVQEEVNAEDRRRRLREQLRQEQMDRSTAFTRRLTGTSAQDIVLMALDGASLVSTGETWSCIREAQSVVRYGGSLETKDQIRGRIRRWMAARPVFLPPEALAVARAMESAVAYLNGLPMSARGKAEEALRHFDQQRPPVSLLG